MIIFLIMEGHFEFLIFTFVNGHLISIRIAELQGQKEVHCAPFHLQNTGHFSTVYIVIFILLYTEYRFAACDSFVSILCLFRKGIMYKFVVYAVPRLVRLKIFLWKTCCFYLFMFSCSCFQILDFTIFAILNCKYCRMIFI